MALKSDNAVVLLSGGMDSATVLALATEQGFRCHALSMAYGQRHAVELSAAEKLAKQFGVAEHKVIPLDLSAFGGSALTDPGIAVPNEPAAGVPVTYVPARNTIFLALGLAWAEVLGANDIFIGVNAVDYSGYPDCRPAFVEAFERVCNLVTKAGIDHNSIRIRAPLIDLSKAEIIAEGIRLGVDFSETISCYSADSGGQACGVCDACRLRARGFEDAGVDDPTRYLA